MFDGVVDDTDVAALMSASCRRDVADLRFYDPTADTLLPYWVESDKRVWVRVPVDGSSHSVRLPPQQKSRR